MENVVYSMIVSSSVAMGVDFVRSWISLEDGVGPFLVSTIHVRCVSHTLSYHASSP
jgi:hypothetical protein